MRGGRRGGGTRPTTMPNLRPKQICRLFAQHGNCRYGDSCKFSHERGSINLNPDGNGKDDKVTAVSPRKEGAAGDWMYLLRSKRPLRPFQLRLVLQESTKLLDTRDASKCQHLIADLAKENGLQHIREFMEGPLPYDNAQDGGHGVSFLRHGIPFFQLLSHSELKHSMVMERSVGTLYNVVYGPGGDRAIDFFGRVIQNLATMAFDEEQTSDDFAASYGYIVSVLLSVVKLNSRAIVQKEFKGFAEVLVNLAQLQDVLKNNDHLNARRDMLALGKRLELGDALMATVQGGMELKNKKPTGRLGSKQTTQDASHIVVDLPGSLSVNGPRHDNDHEQFSLIQILPTADEIVRSERHPFLPLADPTAPHFLTGIPRLFDSQFRLLREDNIGPIREALRELLDMVRETGNQGKQLPEKITVGGTRTIAHKGARIEGVIFHPFKGLQLCVGFNQPKVLKGETKARRQGWWENAFSLDRGSLVCYVDGTTGRCTLLIVSERHVTAPPPRRVAENGDSDPLKAMDPVMERDLSSDPEEAVIRLAFPDQPSNDDIAWLREELNTMRAFGELEAGSYLVEFPKVLLASFKPVLRCVQQQMTLAAPLPFEQWLVPGGQELTRYESGDGAFVSVLPPDYARKTNFTFNLRSIMTGQAAGNRVLTIAPERGDHFDLDLLRQCTTLDRGQCAALVAGLTRELALIQGPPGTGKSYVGVQLIRVLVANNREKRLGLGPIICVCFTNHALDQLLEELLDNDISKILRIGTRSKSTRIKLLNADAGESTPFEDYQARNARRELFTQRDKAHTALAGIRKDENGKKIAWRSLLDHLRITYPHLHEQINPSEEEGEDGFITVSSKRSPIEAWLYDKRAPRASRWDPFDRDVLTDEGTDLWTLAREQRHFLCECWKVELEARSEEDLQDALEDHVEALSQLDKMQQEVNRRQLEACDVIGVTTSGFAKNIDLLRSINAKVLLSEEAGEILEAHTLTNLLPGLEHMILIGDHLQLRPKANNYDLSIESRRGQRYSLDVSLFERLTKAHFGDNDLRFPTAALDTQRRMHPSIAHLVRSTLYPNLKDHTDVLKYPTVTGIRRRLFWLDHRQPESQGDDPSQLMQTSFKNKFEQKMVLALSRHLLRQGSPGGKGLAVITPYVGQLLALKKLMASAYEIVIGDTDQQLLDEQEELADDDGAGSDATGHRRQGSLGSVLSDIPVVQNQRLSQAVRLATVDNFQGEEADVVIISLVRSNRENNCGFLKTKNRINVLLSRARRGMYIIGNANTARSSEMWEDVLHLLEQEDNIGPKLELKCSRHEEKQILVATPEDFNVFSPEGGCDERCTLRLECGHSCRSKCHSLALHRLVPCDEPCYKPLVGCEHACTSTCGAPCARCTVPVEGVILPCQHIVRTMPCHQAQDLGSYKCKVTVARTVPGCGHAVRVPCSADVTEPTFRCTKPCGAPLPTCGHTCTKQCYRCRKVEGGETTIDHGACQKLCERPFNNCAHTCQRNCHAAEERDCGHCMQPCDVKCSHSRCPKKCSEFCAPCAEVCHSGCIHTELCPLPCAVPCEVLPCSERCPEILSCDHQCPSLCGEKCPHVKHCQKCASQEILDTQVDFVMLESYLDVDPNESPLIFLACGHFFTMQTLDGIMGVRDIYEFEDEQILGMKPDAWETPIDKLGGCPTCRMPISNVRRYNHVQKRAQMQIASRKFITQSNKVFADLESQLNAAERLLEETRGPSHDMARYNDIITLVKLIETYTTSVAEVEQPFHKIYDLAVAATRMGHVGSVLMPSVKGVIQFRFWLQGRCLLLRAKTAQNCDRDMILDSDRASVRVADPEKREKTKQAMARRISDQVSKLIGPCESLIAECAKRSQLALEVEARVYFAKLSILRLKRDGKFADPIKSTMLRNEISEHLDACDAIMRSHSGSTQHLASDIRDTRTALQSMAFFTTVTNDERRAVYKAMRQEFGGTGHWYYCPQGHPYSIGECGMAMQSTRCPACGSTIGGANHTLAEGSRRADDFERL